MRERLTCLGSSSDGCTSTQVLEVEGSVMSNGGEGTEAQRQRIAGGQGHTSQENVLLPHQVQLSCVWSLYYCLYDVFSHGSELEVMVAHMGRILF